MNCVQDAAQAQALMQALGASDTECAADAVCAAAADAVRAARGGDVVPQNITGRRAGVYFAVRPEDTIPKTHHQKHPDMVILQCRVNLGTCKIVHRHCAKGMCQNTLALEGCNSVEVLDRTSGTEYVIYDPTLAVVTAVGGHRCHVG